MPEDPRGVRNDSGVPQIYYTNGASGKRVVKPGEYVPHEHMSRDLREVLRKPYVVPRRPLPSVRKMAEVAGAPGTFFPVSVPATAENRREWLSKRPTIRTRSPRYLPGWVEWLASPDAPDARWEIGPGYDFGSDISDGDRVERLVSSMRAVLRGETVDGVRLLRDEPTGDARRALVVLCVHEAPRWAIECFESIVTDPDLPPCDLVVVDDGSTGAARTALEASLRPGEVSDPWTPSDVSWRVLENVGTAPVTGLYHSRASARGYLDSANLGASLYDPDRHGAIVFLNSDTIVGPGWLRALLRALEVDGVAAVNPISTQNVDASVNVPPGCDVEMFSDALLLSSDGRLVESLTPTGFCLAVRGEVWEEFGPYDAKLWGTGYGEETHLLILAMKAGWRCAHVPDAFVFHARSRSHGAGEGSKRSREAGTKIRRLHGAWFDRRLVEHRRRNPLGETRERVASLARLPSLRPPTRRVAWYLKSTLLCGGVYAVMYLSDELRRLGWDSVVCTLEPRDADVYPGRSPIFAFDGEGDFRRSFARDVFDAGFLVSASWVTSEAVEQIHRSTRGDVVGVHFMQDDERRFEFNVGYAKRIEQAWANEHVVANSRWVADVVGTRSLRPPATIRVGFDHLIFYPRPRPTSEKLRVVALCRGETKHRGTDVLFKALREAERLGVPLDVKLFGSRPHDPGFGSEYVGRLSHEVLAPLVASCDVLVDPSRFQGFGLDAVQALACGTALVCTDNLGCEEYAVDGENALIVEPDSPTAIARALLRLHRDRTLLRRLQDAGPSSVEHLSWERLALEWSDLLDRISPW